MKRNTFFVKGLRNTIALVTTLRLYKDFSSKHTLFSIELSSNNYGCSIRSLPFYSLNLCEPFNYQFSFVIRWLTLGIPSFFLNMHLHLALLPSSWSLFFRFCSWLNNQTPLVLLSFIVKNSWSSHLLWTILGYSSIECILGRWDWIITFTLLKFRD